MKVTLRVMGILALYGLGCVAASLIMLAGAYALSGCVCALGWALTHYQRLTLSALTLGVVSLVMLNEERKARNRRGY